MGRACGTYGGKEKFVQGFVRKSDRKRQFVRPRNRWEDNIKMDLHEVGLGVMDWIAVAYGRDKWRVLVNAVMNRRLPWRSCVHFL